MSWYYEIVRRKETNLTMLAGSEFFFLFPFFMHFRVVEIANSINLTELIFSVFFFSEFTKRVTLNRKNI